MIKVEISTEDGQQMFFQLVQKLRRDRAPDRRLVPRVHISSSGQYKMSKNSKREKKTSPQPLKISEKYLYFLRSRA